MTFPFPFVMPSTRPPFAINYTGNGYGTFNSTVGTFANRAIGVEDATRIVVVGVVWVLIGTTNLVSATIGGVSATIIAQNDGVNYGSAMIYARVPTGTVASVVTNFANSVNRVGIGLWRVVGQSSDTPFDFDSPAGGDWETRSATVNIPSGGGVIAIAADGANSAWTGATKRFFATEVSGGDTTVASAATGHVVQVPIIRAITAASWGP